MDIYTNIKNNKYKNKLPYPKMPSRKCDCGHLNNKDARFCSSCGTPTTYKQDLLKHKDKIKAYRNNDSKLYDQFKADLFVDLGITDNPKADKLFSIAWDSGHSGGYSDVANDAWTLVDLIN